MDHFTLQSIVLAKLIAENISSFTRINQFINIISLIFSKQINWGYLMKPYKLRYWIKINKIHVPN